MEAPTIERLRHAYGYDAPEMSQTTRRVAYKAHTPFEAMRRRKSIDAEHFEAAKKLTKHYEGALGVRVGDGDGGHDLDAEFPEIYHGQMLVNAWRQVTPDEKKALKALIEETSTVEDIGRDWLGCRQRGQAHIAGVALVRTGLDRLAIYWAFKSRDP
jgi:hypothetical protein